MILQQTLTQLRSLNLEGMADAFEEQVTMPSTGMAGSATPPSLTLSSTDYCITPIA